MQAKAVSKYNRISARKTRLVADMVRGQKVAVAFNVLKFTPKKAARLVEKTLRSAVANAENNFGMDKKDLSISAITIDEGPTLKRHRPRARGMASAIFKRTAHITIVVESIDKEKNKKETRLRKNATDGQEVKNKKLVKETASNVAHPEDGNGS